MKSPSRSIMTALMAGALCAALAGGQSTTADARLGQFDQEVVVVLFDPARVGATRRALVAVGAVSSNSPGDCTVSTGNGPHDRSKRPLPRGTVSGKRVQSAWQLPW